MVGEVMERSQHEITLINRNALEVKGVLGVESFDTEEFLLQTDYGYLGIRGRDLSIQNLDLDRGIVSIEGNIVDVSYLDARLPRQQSSKGVLGRLFG